MRFRTGWVSQLNLFKDIWTSKMWQSGNKIPFLTGNFFARIWYSWRWAIWCRLVFDLHSFAWSSSNPPLARCHGRSAEITINPPRTDKQSSEWWWCLEYVLGAYERTQVVNWRHNNSKNVGTGHRLTNFRWKWEKNCIWENGANAWVWNLDQREREKKLFFYFKCQIK